MKITHTMIVMFIGSFIIQYFHYYHSLSCMIIHYHYHLFLSLEYSYSDSLKFPQVACNLPEDFQSSV